MVATTGLTVVMNVCYKNVYATGLLERRGKLPRWQNLGVFENNRPRKLMPEVCMAIAHLE